MHCGPLFVNSKPSTLSTPSTFNLHAVVARVQVLDLHCVLMRENIHASMQVSTSGSAHDQRTIHTESIAIIRKREDQRFVYKGNPIQLQSFILLEF